MPFFVYILISQKDQSFYIGYTSNLDRRVKEHNEGSTRYTKNKRPCDLVYSEEYETKSEAIIRERFLKKQRNRQFYQKMIDQ